MPHALCRSSKNAGWSSLVARQAHNLKVAGSNPAPATKPKSLIQRVLCPTKASAIGCY